MYITIFYMFILAVFISAIGGFLLYKMFLKFFQSPLSLIYIVGGILTLVISYPITKLLLFGGIWYFHLPVTGLALMLYILFLIMSNKTYGEAQP
ncbi:hypothetical protein CD32_11360 [Lysinibacillus odysseyi 34hs-1 = NBRC 100172]|uniref:Uncharacterized protein n=2 Tax=Lysinibacillus odysseyi TaxID=202611 RepID=A0A0A3IQ93_9BACI|nr:hypothetical protein CD32_11360 [Lysinibacillus odysseyi 34hs-1 = NBRC 100172]